MVEMSGTKLSTFWASQGMRDAKTNALKSKVQEQIWNTFLASHWVRDAKVNSEVVCLHMHIHTFHDFPWCMLGNGLVSLGRWVSHNHAVA